MNKEESFYEHEVAGPACDYSQQTVAPLPPSWHAAFLATWRYGGPTDAERAFRGDPVDDLVSLAPFGTGRMHLTMLVQSVLRSCSTLDHRRTSLLVSGHPMREPTVLPEGTR